MQLVSADEGTVVKDTLELESVLEMDATQDPIAAYSLENCLEEDLQEDCIISRSFFSSSDDSEDVQSSEILFDDDLYVDPENKWYFTFKPGYYYFSDPEMRTFFNDGGFTFRAETGYNFYGPFIVWLDAGYFQKDGESIGGTEGLDFKLATITLGLKGIYHIEEYAAIYAGLGPRVFMMLMHNDSTYVRGVDNAVGVGGGFDVGCWFFPIPKWKNCYFDVFADYSWKELGVDEDEISSIDSDVDVSGLSVGVGFGIQF